MENPLHWGYVRKAINEAITSHNADMTEGRPGFSVESRIYHKLLEHGYCIDETPGPESTDGQIRHDLLLTFRAWADNLVKAAGPLRIDICEAAEFDKLWENLAEALFGKDWHKHEEEEDGPARKKPASA